MDPILNRIGLVSRSAIHRQIEFSLYRRPQTVVYPANAVVLNPMHTAAAAKATSTAKGASKAHGDTPSSDASSAQLETGKSKTTTTTATTLPRKSAGRPTPPPGADNDDPMYQAVEDMLCNDETLVKLVRLGWSEVGGLGAGLHNFSNTCYMNATLQAIAHVPPLAQYFMQNFRSREANPNAPMDFAFFLADVLRQIHTGRGVIMPTDLAKNVRVLSKLFRLGEQADAMEFFVYLMEAAQKSLMWRLTGVKEGARKMPLLVSQSTALLRISSGYYRSQVAWSKQEEIALLRNGHFTQAAMDLQMNKTLGEKLVSNTYDPFSLLSVQVVGNSLQDCLQAYTVVEQLPGRIYTTPRKVQVRATKQLLVRMAPITLVIQLKRFTFMRTKISKYVAFPLTLDLKPYVANDGAQTGTPLLDAMQYVLQAIIVHHGGSLNSGHYTSYVRAKNGLWAHCDDSSVRSVSEQEVLRQQAYMLFYSKSESAVTSAAASKLPTTAQGPTSDTRRSGSPLLQKAAQPQSQQPQQQQHLHYGRELSEDEIAQALALRKKKSQSGGDAESQRRSPRLAARSPKLEPSSGTVSLQNKSHAATGHTAAVGARRAYKDSDSDDEEKPHQSGKSAVTHPQRAQSTSAISGEEEEQRDANGNGSQNADRAAAVAVGTDARGAEAVRALYANKLRNHMPTVERPRHAPKLKVRVRDEAWEQEMDRGRVKKLRRKDDPNNEGDQPNRFQSTGLQFDLRGRRQ